MDLEADKQEKCRHCCLYWEQCLNHSEEIGSLSCQFSIDFSLLLKLKWSKNSAICEFGKLPTKNSERKEAKSSEPHLQKWSHLSLTLKIILQ
jgi:hypothetical protein